VTIWYSVVGGPWYSSVTVVSAPQTVSAGGVKVVRVV
jgi:hypothetical protein